MRPSSRRDGYSRVAYAWAEQTKAKAVAEGWLVEDLRGSAANRANIERALSRVVAERPRLVIHYDHGSEFTLYGCPRRRGTYTIDDRVPILDERNVALAAGTFVSAMACLSASGLGPLAVYEGATGYLGYTGALWGSLTQPVRFGEALNAPNYALLEGRSAAEAYEVGRQAWETLHAELLEEYEAPSSSLNPLDPDLWDISCSSLNRDSLALLQPD